MSGVQKITVSVDENDTRLDRWIKRRFAGLGQSQIEKALRKGDLRVDGKRCKSNFRLLTGMQVRLPPFSVNKPKRPAGPELDDKDRRFVKSLVIYDDKQVLVLNKPAGLAVQGGTGTTRHIDGMLSAFDDGEYLPKLVHRLDRDTSGLLILGRTPAATAALAKAFKSRSAKKTYLAIVLGNPRPEQGVIKGYMKKGEGLKG
ncbi:Ribosomal large subunit pseudouridine synthase C, partial [hydrothermal vent metagenome]